MYDEGMKRADERAGEWILKGSLSPSTDWEDDIRSRSRGSIKPSPFPAFDYNQFSGGMYPVGRACGHVESCWYRG